MDENIDPNKPKLTEQDSSRDLLGDVDPTLKKDVLGMMKNKLNTHKKEVKKKTEQKINDMHQKAIDAAAKVGKRRKAEAEERAAQNREKYGIRGGKSRKRKRRRNKRKTRKAKRTVRRRKSRKSKKSRRRRRRR